MNDKNGKGMGKGGNERRIVLLFKKSCDCLDLIGGKKRRSMCLYWLGVCCAITVTVVAVSMKESSVEW